MPDRTALARLASCAAVTPQSLLAPTISNFIRAATGALSRLQASRIARSQFASARRQSAWLASDRRKRPFHQQRLTTFRAAGFTLAFSNIQPLAAYCQGMRVATIESFWSQPYFGLTSRQWPVPAAPRYIPLPTLVGCDRRRSVDRLDLSLMPTVSVRKYLGPISSRRSLPDHREQNYAASVSY